MRRTDLEDRSISILFSTPSETAPIGKIDELLGGGEKRISKVCFICPEFHGPQLTSRIGERMTGLALATAEAGHAVAVLYTGKRRCERESVDYWSSFYRGRGIAFQMLEEPDDRLAGLSGTVKSYEVFRWLSERQFDVVHSPAACGLTYLAALAKRQDQLFQSTTFCTHLIEPLLWRKGESGEPLERIEDLERSYLEQAASELADIVCSGTEYMFRWAESAGWRLPPAVLQSIPLSFDVRRSESSSSAAAAATALNPLELILFGELDRISGIDLLTRALLLLPTERKSRLLVRFAGNPGIVDGIPAQTYLERELAPNGINYTIWTDSTYEEIIRHASQTNGIIVCADIIASEAPLLDAGRIAGQTILASDLPAHRERLAGYGRASLFRARDESDLSARISELLEGYRDWSESTDGSALDCVQAWKQWHANPFKATATSPASTVAPTVTLCLAVRGEKLASRRLTFQPLHGSSQPNMDLIIVTDRTAQELSELVDHQPFPPAAVRIEHAPPGASLGALWNRAARLSKAELLIFLDEQTSVVLDHLAGFLNATGATGADATVGLIDYFAETVSKRGPHGARPSFRWIPTGPSLGLGMFINCFGSATSVIRRSTLFDTGGFSEERSAFPEWQLFLGWVAAGKKLHVLPRTIAHCTLPPGDQAASSTLPWEIDYSLAATRMARELPKQLVTPFLFARNALRQLFETGGAIPKRHSTHERRSLSDIFQSLSGVLLSVKGAQDVKLLEPMGMVEMSVTDQHIELRSTGSDPQIFLPTLEVPAGLSALCRLEIELLTDHDDASVQLFYTSKGAKLFSERESTLASIHQGKNVLYLQISSELGISGALRLDPLNAPGTVILRSLEVRLMQS
ncbi:MAG: hypothetical protein U0136_10750 [Bdellovibrionota bacterium]